MKRVWRKLFAVDFCEGGASEDGYESESEDQQQVAFSGGLFASSHLACGRAIAFIKHGYEGTSVDDS